MADAANVVVEELNRLSDNESDTSIDQTNGLVSSNARFMKQCPSLLNLYLPPSKLDTDTPLLGLGETADQSQELYAS